MQVRRMFHSVCGEYITFYNNYTTASRNISDFNNGLVFSRDPLSVNSLFEIKIEKKVYTWSGGLEFGVTKCDPDYIVVPTNATDLKQGTWILSGSSVLKDGRSLLDIYSLNLNAIDEGDIVGVMRTDRDELIFSLNGQLKGVAAQNLPRRIFVVIDLYGQVSQASIVTSRSCFNVQPVSSDSNEAADMYESNDNIESNSLVSSVISNSDNISHLVSQSDMDVQNAYAFVHEKIRFNTKAGILVKVSYNGRTAERLKPLDEFNNGVVMTNRPLYNNELFEIRIDCLMEKWSGSIEVGVTTHNPDYLTFPPTMTNLKIGTIMMSGCGILTNGKATMRDYGNFNLDELMIGDRIGLVRKPNGNLHYIINGLDQGCAAINTPEPVWAVVDLYGRTVKVTIVDRDEREEQNLITRRNTVLRNGCSLTNLNPNILEDLDDRLAFHTRCGAHAAVINNNRTAYRPKSRDDFNNGVVITNRPLKRNEVFEVRLDKMVTKWAGSIEIGVTTHSPTEIEYPSTMTNIRSGTWMMTGNGVMHNGTTVIDDYGTNLDRLQVADRVAVVVRENGSLHFFVNGVDQGEAACNLPSQLYGVIDLYGQAAQATIVDYNLICCCSSPSNNGFPSLIQNHIDLHFHHIHGKNVRICNGGRTAFRPFGYAEFTDAVVISNRPLKHNEMFAVVVEKIIGKWSGSLEMGVTGNKPDDFELPSTMTDIDNDIWMLSGSTVMQNGEIIKNEYSLNLDTIEEGMVVGLMRHNDKTLHFYLNGVDQGEACTDLPSVLYPIIDLYGQCAQVLIVSPPEHRMDNLANDNANVQNGLNWIDDEPIAVVSGSLITTDDMHGLFIKCGKNIRLKQNDIIARRVSSYDNGIVFSNHQLKNDRLFEVKITKWNAKFAGYISIGVATARPENSSSSLPSTLPLLKPDIWYLLGDEVWHNGRLLKSQYCHNLHWLQSGSLIGIKRTSDDALHFFINGQDQGVAAHDLPQDLYAVVDVYGSTTEIMVVKETTDTTTIAHTVNNLTSLRESFVSTNSSVTQDNRELDDLKLERSKMKHYLAVNYDRKVSDGYMDNVILQDKNDMIFDWMFFSELKGRNIRLLNNNKTAVRIESYNQGLVILAKPLPRDTLLQVVVENLNSRWVSSLIIGILCHPLLRSSLPTTALGFKKDAWFIAGDSVYYNGNKVRSRYCPSLENLSVNQRVGIMVDSSSQLKLFIDGVDQGVAAFNIPPACFVVLDLYGQCEQITVVNVDTKTNVTADIEILENNDISTRNEIVGSHEDLSACEKADLEHHEKESPSSDELTESNLKLNKTNENMMTVSSSSMISSAASLELDRKSITSCDNLSLQHYEQKQMAAEMLSKHMSATNCDHKTSLNIANATYIQAEKSKNSALTRSLNTFSQSLSPLSSVITERPSVHSIKPNINCEYRINCLRLRMHLGIPDNFFISESSIVCYCKSCCPNIAQELKGEPPSLYSVPSGWCKFPIKKHLMTNNVDSFTLEKWHVAFVGTSFASIRKILDTSQLYPLEKPGIVYDKRKNQIKCDNGLLPRVVLSPSIKFAVNSNSAAVYRYIDQKTNQRYECSAVFQVLVRPGSYKACSPTCSSNVASGRFDDAFDVQTLEWIIKEKDATVLSSLLFKMEPL